MFQDLLLLHPRILFHRFKTTEYDAKTTDQIENGVRRVADDCESPTLPLKKFETQTASTGRKANGGKKKNLDHQIRSDVWDARGVLTLPTDRKEPHPGSITDECLTVSDRKQATK